MLPTISIGKGELKVEIEVKGKICFEIVKLLYQDQLIKKIYVPMVEIELCTYLFQSCKNVPVASRGRRTGFHCWYFYVFSPGFYHYVTQLLEQFT